MPSVRVENEHKILEVLQGTNLRKAALKSGVHLYSPFFRIFHLNLDFGPLKFPCGADVVEILDGKGATARSPEEERALRGRWLVKRKVPPNARLSCQVVVNGDLTIRTRPALEIDNEATKKHLGFLALVAGFLAITALAFALIGLDLVKLL